MNNTKTRAFLALLALLFVHTVAFAQGVTLKGQLWDGTFNEPIIGANVTIKGTTDGTITDFDGNFVIKAEEGQTIVFSYIGYQTKEFKIKKGLDVSRVVLSEDSEQLDEVIVVGYGQQKKESTVGAIASAKGDDLLQVGSVRSVSEALQGQMPGVTAINTTSKPGADNASIFIRGKATWGNASPMVLVDGIERDFNDIDVNEIESISVLKDASATAVYGVKGANGVILVTTKRGKNEAPIIKFSTNFGVKMPTTDYEFADYLTSMDMFNEAAANDNQWDKIIPESTRRAWEMAYATGNYGPYNDYFPQIDWQDEVIKDFATQQNYNVNISGGTERMKYFASLGYLQDGDIYKTQKNEEYDPSFFYKRYNWRTNFDFEVTSTTTLSVNVAGKMGYQNEPGFRVNDGGGDSYLFDQFISTPTNLFPLRYSDGTFGAQADGGGNLVAALNNVGQRQTKSFQGFYDIKLNQKLDMITKGLSARVAVSYTASSSERFELLKGGYYGQGASEADKQAYVRIFRDYDYSSPIVAPDGSITYPYVETVNPPQTEDDLPTGSTYDIYEASSRKLYYEFALNYKRTFGDHDVTALALVNRRTQQSKVEFPSYEEDWVGRITYNYKQRYLTEFNGSYTGSEKFAPGKRFGFFPSFSLGWRVSEEPFLEKARNSWLNNLKVRYSWGKVGSDNGAPRFNYLQTYTSSGNIIFGNSSNVTQGPFYFEGALADPNATWETAIKQNLGVELRVIDKLNLTVDLFNEHRTGILMARQSIAPWIGAPLPSMNLGEVKNHGLEFDLTFNDNIGKFNYFAKFNFATSENRQVYRDDPLGLYDYQKSAGKPIGFQNRYEVTGNYGSIDDIFNSPQTSIPKTSQGTLVPGDLAYLDYNADGVIDAKDKVPMKELNYPLTTYGLTLGFNYKGIGFNALIYAAPGVYKNQIDSYLFDFPASNIKAQPNTLDRWTSQDISTLDVIRPSVHLDNTYNSQENTYIYTNHGYLRLKNVEVNYTLPKAITQKAMISNCQFYVNGSNLLTFTGVDDRRDPETADGSTYPIVKRFNVGVRLTFN